MTRSPRLRPHAPLLALLLIALPALQPVAGQLPDDLDGIAIEDLLSLPLDATAKHGETSSETAASVTIVTADEIQRYGYRTLADLFAAVPGVFVTDDRDAVRLGIRGFSPSSDLYSRVLLMLNGTALNENIWGAPGVGTTLGLSLDGVERVEIVRGPGSALYGTGALFAVVNVTTKTGRAVDGLRWSADVGSFGTRTARATYGKPFGNGLDLALAGQWGRSEGQDLYYPEFDRQETNRGVAEGLDWDDHYGLTARATYGSFSLQGHLSSQESGNPTAYYGSDFNDDRTRGRVDLGLAELRYERQLEPGRRLMLRGYVNDYTADNDFLISDRLRTETALGDWWGGEFRYTWATHSRHVLIVGAGYQDSRGDFQEIDVGRRVHVEGGDSFHIQSAYLQDELQLTDGLSLTLGLRHDRYSTIGSTTTPRAAVVYHPSGSSTLKLLYGDAFRAASIYESTFAVPGEAKPNPDLDPERVRTLEAVWEQRLAPSIHAVMSLYDYRMDDLIGLTTDLEDLLDQYDNILGVEGRGLEVGLTLRRRSGLHGYASYGLQETQDAASGRRLTNSPTHLAKAGLSGTLTRHLTAAVSMRYESGRRTLFATDTDAHVLTDARVGLRLPPAGPPSLRPHLRSMTLSLAVRNLFDVACATPGSIGHRQVEIPQNGRTFVLRLDHRL